MKIISFMEDDAVIERILKHCGKWKVGIARLPSISGTTAPVTVADPDKKSDKLGKPDQSTFKRFN